MKCKKKNVNELVGTSVWYLNGAGCPRCGEIKKAIYSEKHNDTLVIIGHDSYETSRYLNKCYSTLDELGNHMFNSYDVNLQKIINKIKEKLLCEIFCGKNGEDLSLKGMYILLDYYANKQIKNYDERVVFGQIKDMIVTYIEKAIDKICNDIK